MLLIIVDCQSHSGMYHKRCSHASIQVSACTNTDVGMHQYRCRHAPIQVSACTNTDVSMYQYRCRHTPIQVSACTNTGVGNHQNRYFHTKKDVLFAIQIRHFVPACVHHFTCGRNRSRVIRQPQTVVCAEVQHFLAFYRT
jgi:hypothetical protein